jgi:hypothetical protein
MDDDRDEIRVVEGGGRLKVGLIIKVPVWGPQPPQQFAEVATILCQARTAALGVKIILVPTAPFVLRLLRVDRSGNVLNIVAVSRISSRS